MSDHLQSFLADRDEPCPACGYSLRGLTTPTCPECRAAVTLQVVNHQGQRKVLYACAAVSTVIPLWSAILLIFVGWAYWIGRTNPWMGGPTPGELIVQCVLAGACAITLIAYVFTRWHVYHGLRNPNQALRSIHAVAKFVALVVALGTIYALAKYIVGILGL